MKHLTLLVQRPRLDFPIFFAKYFCFLHTSNMLMRLQTGTLRRATGGQTAPAIGATVAPVAWQDKLLLKGAQSTSPVPLTVFHKLLLLQIMRLLIYSFFRLRFSQQSISQCLTIAILFFSILTIAFLILSCSHDCISRLVDHVVHVI
jgi:hypothetical protein